MCLILNDMIGNNSFSLMKGSSHCRTRHANIFETLCSKALCAWVHRQQFKASQTCCWTKAALIMLPFKMPSFISIAHIICWEDKCIQQIMQFFSKKQMFKMDCSTSLSQTKSLLLFIWHACMMQRLAAYMENSKLVIDIASELAIMQCN